MSLATIIEAPLPPAAWCVEPLISDGGRVLIYGESGAGKSWALVSLGLHIAAGQPWLGQYPIHGPRRVLYIDEEMSPRLLRRRVKRLAAGMECPEGVPFRALSRHAVHLNAEGVRGLLADLKRSGFDPDVVIVETFRRVFHGNENDAQAVTEFWRAVEPVTRAGKTLIVSHHMKKPQPGGGGNIKHKASGSTDLIAAVDDALAVTRIGKDGFTVEPAKCREAEEAPAFAVSLVEPQGVNGPMLLRHEGSPAGYRTKATKQAQAESLILGVLREAPNETLGTGSILDCLKDREISEDAGERALARLFKAGQVLRPEKGVYQLPSTPPVGSSRIPQEPYRESAAGWEPSGAPLPSQGTGPSRNPSRKGETAGSTLVAPYALFDTPCQPVPPEMADQEAL